MANAISHGIGIIAVLAFSPLLFLKANSQNSNLILPAISAYVFGLLMVFTFSTLYHATFEPTAKKILRIFDHISIFLLIGGTYFPFVVLYAEPERAKWFLGIQWTIILVGIINKIFFTGKFRLLSSLIYIGIGAMVLGIGQGFWQNMPVLSVYFLIGGGLLYVVGVYFYQNQNIKYHHFIWHLFVLGAAKLHFLAVYFAF